MNKAIKTWNMPQLTAMIVATLLNKYDCFTVVEGHTGNGKSTLAFHIASSVAREFRRLYRFNEDRLEYYYERVGKRLRMDYSKFMKKIIDLKEKRAYQFFPARDLIYTQDEMLRGLASWHKINLPDELINVTFNRDFFSEKQKDIIKMINMYRDHENLTICCVPQFQNIDTQIKNLTKLKITVRKRGIAIIHTPNKVIYCKDKWDTATNEKIEREWIIKKKMHPNYSKLTTFRGLIYFPPLSIKQEVLYQQIKNQKRANILKNELHINIENIKTPFDNLIEKVINRAVKNGNVLEGYADAMGLTKDNLRRKVSDELKKRNLPTAISDYYSDKKAKYMEKDDVFNIA